MKLSELPKWFLKVEDSARVWRFLDMEIHHAGQILDNSKIIICWLQDGCYYLEAIEDMKELQAWFNEDEHPEETVFVYNVKLEKFYTVKHLFEVEEVE